MFKQSDIIQNKTNKHRYQVITVFYEDFRSNQVIALLVEDLTFGTIEEITEDYLCNFEVVKRFFNIKHNLLNIVNVKPLDSKCLAMFKTSFFSTIYGDYKRITIKPNNAFIKRSPAKKV